MGAGFAPTEEQQYAREQFATGETLAINAYAGTGKTSTLLLLADDASGRRGQYIAFNKAIVEEGSRKFPQHVACNTAHSLAFRATGRPMAHRLRGGRIKSAEIARRLRIDPFHCTIDGNRKTLTPGYLAGLAMRAVTNFCQSADEAPAPKHVPYQEGIDLPLGGRKTWDNNRVLREHLMPAIRMAWADVTNPDGGLPYKHEHYLKAWQLAEPFIPADWIAFDEAQDANPVMAAIVDAQEHAQRVYTGDSYQQIYTFTGAVNTLSRLQTARTAMLTQSFRFGPAVAEVANLVLTELGAELPLLGFDQIDSTVGEIESPDCILTRTNARAVSTLLNAIRQGRRPHLVGGGREVVAFARAVDDLHRDGRTSYPDLACFASWGEVTEYVQEDPQGSELSLMVKLIEEFGTETILEALDRMPSEANAGLIISTAHKSKGREWHRVQLGNDFPDPTADRRSAEIIGDDDGASEEELRLLYVAATRAQHQLDVQAVTYFTSQLGLEEPEPPAVIQGGPVQATTESGLALFYTATGEPVMEGEER